MTMQLGALVRISDAREADTAGVDRQETDCRLLCDRLPAPAGYDGIAITRVYVENDTSAFKRRRVSLPDGSTGMRTVRPQFRQALTDLATGAIQGLVVYDLDRIARDPRDLEDLIDVVQVAKARVWAVTGSLDLSTDAGITMSRIMVAVANKSSLDASRRIRRKHEELAEQGKTGGGGHRRYGYADDRRTIVPEEAEIIRECARRVLKGESLRALAKNLTERGVPTALGNSKWHPRSIHSFLTSGHQAGLRVFRGEVVGEADWPAILDRDTWDRVRLALEKRKPTEGGSTELQRWLTGVVLCGACGRALKGWSAPGGGRRYWCASPHPHGGCGSTSISAPHAEKAARRLILAYFRRPDILGILAAQVSPAAADAARTAAVEDEAQLKELAAMWGRKEITSAEYLAARKPIEARLAEYQAVARASVPGAVRKLLEAKDRAAAFDALAPQGKREVARTVFRHGIEIVPPNSGGSTFDPSRLSVLVKPWAMP
jgi:site-specific DNA recombinase